MTSEAQKAAMDRYRKKTRQVLIRVNPETEPAIARRLGEVKNMSGYIKALILKDIHGKDDSGEQ